MKKNKGHFITFEGGEGSGKSTIIDAIYKKILELNLPVICVREPGGTELGEGIRRLLLEVQEHIEIGDRTEIFLFLASRAQHVKEKILPAISEGKIVLCDRFNDSSIAYQGVARGLGAEDVARMCAFASKGLNIDLTVFLDVDPKIGLQRTRKISKEHAEANSLDRIERERLDFHENVRNGYLKLAKENPERIVVVDAHLPIPDVIEQAWQAVKLKLRV